jgi:signal transduction histidine kinase
VEASEKRDIQLDIPGDAELETDPMRLEQILVNLLSNACKYGGEFVGLHVALDADEVSFVVEDDGSGIPDDLAPRLFEPFARAGGLRSAGTGLGLAITRLLAHALGGEISYEPRTPSGSCFTLTLPLERPTSLNT